MGGEAAKNFVSNTSFIAQIQPVVEIMAQTLRMVDKQAYDDLMSSANAAKLLTRMFGPWMVLAILYKLQIGLHHDKSDHSLTGMTNFGHYTGGRLHVPVLGLACV